MPFSKFYFQLFHCVHHGEQLVSSCSLALFFSILTSTPEQKAARRTQMDGIEHAEFFFSSICACESQ